MQLQQGDTEALHFLYVRYAPDVLSCIRDDVRGDHRAEEVARGVFQGLIARIEQYEEGREPFVSWLLDVARDAARERVKL
jgi:DNA-directed RNA polymerase specialized sigma24 family protein